MTMPNWVFKAKLVERFGSCARAAAALGLSNSRLSLLVNEYRAATSEELALIERVVGRDARDSLCVSGGRGQKSASQ